MVFGADQDSVNILIGKLLIQLSVDPLLILTVVLIKCTCSYYIQSVNSQGSIIPNTR